jgi:hypothetical protein
MTTGEQKFREDYTLMCSLVDELAQPSHGSLLDDITEHAQLETFTRRYLFKTPIFSGKKPIAN